GVDEVIVLGAAPATRTYPSDAPAPVGRFAPAPAHAPQEGSLPASLAVGRATLAGHSVPLVLQGVDHGAPPRRTGELGRQINARPGRTGLIVAADGSARRGEKAPGYVDPRALETDILIGKALALADRPALLALDPADCDGLLIAGRAAWQVMASACEGTSWTGGVLYEGDPFGVAYWVTTWVPAEE
ncbi:MAG TPA: hypothetical protein VIR33_10805, partial [Thermopolyspora sp.]